MPTTTTFLNCDIQCITQQELLENLHEGVLVTPNVDHLMKMQKDREFYEIIRSSEWVVCDSKILRILSVLLKNELPQTIPGSSFFTAFYEYHQQDPNCKIFLLGAREGVAAKAMERINERMGREMVIGALSPSFGFEKKEEECEEIIRTINASGANVVLVGVGAPKQEKWIAKHKDRMPGVKIWMALGATIDFEAGNVKRAPRLVQKGAMEWFYRFLKEPRRLYHRYFIEDVKFFWYFGKQLVGMYRDPWEAGKR